MLYANRMGEGEALTEDLIDEIYAAAEDPQRFDSLMEAWEAHLAENGGSQEDRLSPHLSRALRLFEHIEMGRAGDDAVAQLVELMPAAALVLDGNLDITAMSASAAAMAGDEASERLPALIGATAHRRLQRWMESAEGDADILYLNVGGAFDPGTSMLARRIHVMGRDTVLLANTDMRLRPAEAEALSSAFGLTAAETEIAVAVGEGHSVAAIAINRDVSELTVRTQLRKIFAKTGADGLTGLVRLVCGFAAAGAADILVPPSKVGAAGNWRRRGVLPSGRKLGWLDMGDPDGRPVLMFHSMLSDGTLTRSFVDRLASAGWRIIVPHRASVGETPSEPATERYGMAARAAKDAADLLDMLGVGDVILAGLHGGSLYVPAFVQACPGRARAILYLSHAPFWSAELLDRMARRQRVMARTTVYAPGALRMIVRAGCASIMAGHHEAFLRGLYREGTADRLALTNPEIMEAAASGLRGAARQGGGGFVDDAPLILSDWTEGMDDVKIPQIVLYGEDDPVSGKGYAVGYCKAVGHARSISIPKAGQLIHLSHWEKVLSALEELDTEAANPKTG